MEPTFETNAAAPQRMFTAAHIAAALAMKRQAVQWHLRDVSPAGVRIVAGNEASAWMVDQLPLALSEPEPVTRIERGNLGVSGSRLTEDFKDRESVV